MPLSIFLARAFGLYLVIIAFFYFIRGKFIREMVTDFFHNKSLLLFSGVINLILGLLVVVGHNVWIDWPIVITLLGYLMLLKAFTRLFIPMGADQKILQKLTSNSGLVYTGIFTLIVGLFLIYEGFLATL